MTHRRTPEENMSVLPRSDSREDKQRRETRGKQLKNKGDTEGVTYEGSEIQRRDKGGRTTKRGRNKEGETIDMREIKASKYNREIIRENISEKEGSIWGE